EGGINHNLPAEFESWFNDHIGLRDPMIRANASIRIRLFGEMPPGADYRLGPNGELNYVGQIVIPEYQHTNLLPEEQIQRICDSYTVVNDYLEHRGIRFYYMQNWDKQSIYPEYFPDSVIQYGDVSMTDQVVDALKTRTSVPVISTKEVLIAGKEQYETYSIWGNSTHWTDRGAYLGYRQLMETIAQDYEEFSTQKTQKTEPIKILSEDDYIITEKDLGDTLFGGIHVENISEEFVLRDPKAVLENDRLTLYKDLDPRQSYHVNSEAGNDLKLLIIGDSYIEMFLIDDISESFSETIQLWSVTMFDLKKIVDEYEPDIVLYERAEREPGFDDVIRAADSIREE
ncbi:MAG: hypothetical protein J5825_04430, partial [Lachnospiraceae bacterium]|nr:hypothetical protein [Lachnospiraceae bacterium]